MISEIRAEPLRIQIAFQGGGAKLVPLIAAVEGLLDAAPADKVEITNVSGSSAGAIAAAIFCSGIDPAEFRKRIQSRGTHFEKRIVRSIQKWDPTLYVRLFNGSPIYDHVAYRDFLRFLFEDEEQGTVLQMPDTPTLRICQSSLESGAICKIFKSRTDDLIDELVKSSAIPFVFHAHSISYPQVDGGMLNNLPTDVLPEQDGYRIGIKFKVKPRATPKSATSYAMAVVSCVIDASVTRAQLAEGLHLVEIETSIDTFDFKGAITFAGSPEYMNLRKYVSAQFKEIIAALETDRAIETVERRSSEEIARIQERYADEIGQMHGKVQVIHDSLRRNIQLRIVRKVVENKCYNLLDSDPSARKDVCIVREKVQPSGPMFAYGASLSTGDMPTVSKDLEFSVYDADWQRQSASQVAMPSYYRSPVSTTLCNVMLFFSPPLDPANGPFEIDWANSTSEVLYDILGDKKEDFVMHVCKDAETIEELYLVCQVPKIYEGQIDLQDDQRFKPADKNWVSGRILAQTELAALKLGPPELRMFRIGWFVKNLIQGSACGFRAFLKPST